MAYVWYPSRDNMAAQLPCCRCIWCYWSGTSSRGRGGPWFCKQLQLIVFRWPHLIRKLTKVKLPLKVNGVLDNLASTFLVLATTDNYASIQILSITVNWKFIFQLEREGDEEWKREREREIYLVCMTIFTVVIIILNTLWPKHIAYCSVCFWVDVHVK